MTYLNERIPQLVAQLDATWDQVVARRKVRAAAQHVQERPGNHQAGQREQLQQSHSRNLASDHSQAQLMGCTGSTGIHLGGHTDSGRTAS